MKQLLFILSISILLSSRSIGQTLVYETGVGTTDPWTGWVADSGYDCIGSMIDATNSWQFDFDTQVYEFIYATVTKQIDLTAYSKLIFEYQMEFENDAVYWNVTASPDSENFYGVNGSATPYSPFTDSVPYIGPVNYVRLTMNASSQYPLPSLSFDYLRIYDASNIGLNELSGIQQKELVKITDLMGRETEGRPNTLLIYVYSDGTTEKVFRVE